MKTNYIVPIATLLFMAGCGSQKQMVRKPDTSSVSLPSFELQPEKTSQSEKKDSLMQLFCPTPPKHEVRAVWLTTLGGLDWPTTKANTPERISRQKAELTAILDKYREAGINTVLLQTRVRGSVIYPSALEPWDLGLTGHYNQNPGYDPLQFAIDECHKRGMELQAWLVAIPLGKVALNNGYGKYSVVRQQPSLCIRSGDEWFMNPGNPGTPAYLASIAREIVSRYDVDGINLDYIRYPEEPHILNDKSSYRKYGKGLSLADWRRQNITNCVRAIYKAVKACKPWVKVSSSPIGKYRDLTRFSSFGWNSRDKVFQETERWFEEGIHDEIFPMMYFDGKHFYPFASDWQENSFGRLIVPGLGIYFLDKSLKDWPLSIIQRQIGVTRSLEMGGQAYFRSRFFTNDTKGIYDYAKDRLYTTPALQPPMQWINTSAPSAPGQISIHSSSDGDTHLTWQAPAKSDSVPVRYTVYASAQSPVDTGDPRNILKTAVSTTSYTDSSFAEKSRRLYYAVTSCDGYGKESKPAETASLPTAYLQTENNKLIIPSSITEDTTIEWLIITDAYGRTIAKAKPTGKLDISSLPMGYYKVATLKKEAASPVQSGFFLK